jgi:hypothetical protein
MRLKELPPKIKWDIWYAYVKYEDIADGKIRPVIIAEDKAFVLEVLPVYGAPSDNADYELWDWADAGLAKPSAVKLSPISVQPSDFERRIGRLSIIDIRKIIKLLAAPKII